MNFDETNRAHVSEGVALTRIFSLDEVFQASLALILASGGVGLKNILTR